MLGILDPGIGGLGIARKIMERSPDCDILYFGDTARAPYGDKSAATVIRYALQNTEILLQKGAKAVLIASHTIACVAGRQVREAFGVPVLDVTGPTVTLALHTSPKCVVGIVASRAAVDSNCYPEAIQNLNAEAKVYSAVCPLLVPLVDEGWLKKPETVRIVKKYLHPLKVRQIDTLILGGNHYALLKKIIQRKIGKRVYIIDAGDAVPAALVDFFNENGELKSTICKGGRHQFLVSDLNEHLSKSAKRLYGGNIDLELMPCR
ncbi:MAG: glutamate racemase [Desulfobacterales bacterium]|nr:glutamate racemase [Desulfobacterales bacterium]